MRTQLLTVLVSFSWSSAFLMAAGTRWIATTRRWRDQRIIAVHMATGALFALSQTAPTIQGLPIAALQACSAVSILAGALHYNTWERVLASLEGRALRPWERLLQGARVALAALAFVPGLVFGGELIRFGYPALGMASWDVAPGRFGDALIAALVGSHLATMRGLYLAALRGAHGARVFAVAASGEILFTVVDLASLAGVLPLPYLTPFWSMFYIGAMATSIARRFVADAAELDALSDRLEERVAARTRELAEARSIAERALEARGNFLATMSHEIRTPLHGVLGMTGLLLDGAPSAEQRGQLETIQRCGGSLLTLLNDILDFAKIEAGHLELEALAYAPRGLTAECVEVLARAAAERDTRLTWSVDAEVPARLLGDPARVRQVLLNLVGNAVKFTRGGAVTVRASREDARLRFVVQDTGVGIAPEALARLFHPFVQADASTTRRFGGTGLGLAICRRLVDAMGGQIGVESAVGRGSTFWFTVRLTEPPAEARAATPPPARPPSGRSLRVLVAEDNLVNQRVVSLFLSRRGHQVRVVGDGRQALDVLAEDAFDVVLMDCEMPELDGYAATRLLREREGAGRRTRVIALTANAFDEDRQRALAAGMDAWVPKPFRQEELLHALASAPPGPARTLPPERPAA